MIKIILLICLLLFACQSGFAGTASVFNNIDADNLRDQIIKLYTLEGAHVDYSFSDTFEIGFWDV